MQERKTDSPSGQKPSTDAIVTNPSWPTVNTSTSENVNRLNITKSEEFLNVSKDYFIEKK